MPRVPEPEAFGNERVDTSPVLSREFEQGIPDVNAFTGGSNLRGRGQFTQALRGATNTFDKIQHNKRVVANRNTAIRTNTEYNSEIASLKRELSERRGFEAEGVAEEFLERESIIREKHLKDKNHVVQDNLLNVFEGAKEDGFGQLTKHEREQFISDTKIATSMHINELRDESIQNGGTESIASTLEGMHDTVEGIDFMTDAEKESFIDKGKTELYEGHFKKLLSEDTFESTDKAVQLLLDRGEDIPPLVVASIMPTLAGRVIEKDVEFEVGKMAESMSYAQGNDYIESKFHGKKRKAMFVAWGAKYSRDKREKALGTIDMTGDVVKLISATKDPMEQERIIKEWYNGQSVEDKMALLGSKQFSLINRMVGMDIDSAQSMAYAKAWNQLNNPSGLGMIEDIDKDGKKYTRPKTKDDVLEEIEHMTREGLLRKEDYDSIMSDYEKAVEGRGPQKLTQFDKTLIADFKRNNKNFFGTDDRNNPEGRLRSAELDTAILEYSKESKDLTPEQRAQRLNYMFEPIEGGSYKIDGRKIQYRFQEMSNLSNQAEAFNNFETLIRYDIDGYDMPEELRENILSLSREGLRNSQKLANEDLDFALSFQEVYALAGRAYLDPKNPNPNPELTEYFNRYTENDPAMMSFISKIENELARSEGVDLSETGRLSDGVDITPIQDSYYDLLDEVSNDPEAGADIIEDEELTGRITDAFRNAQGGRNK